MKKVLSTCIFAALSTISFAQLNLSGSSYTQNFNSLAPSVGLPTGWSVAVDATTTTLGQNVVSTKYNANHPTWKTFTNGFKNLASANGITMATYFAFYNDSLAQANAADRALAVRQTSAVGDSGAAFILQIANTKNLSNFNLSFQLQSLDTSCPRVTTWRVDYATGSNPTSFTQVATTGTMTTGGKTFTNETITAPFGNALDNKQGTVWIRIVAVTKSTGSGNRATTAIDDFNLTWTGVATGVEEKKADASSFAVAGIPDNNSLSLVYDLAPGAYQLAVRNLNGQTIYSENLYHNGGKAARTLHYPTIPSGFYIATIEGKGQAATAKFIIQ